MATLVLLACIFVVVAFTSKKESISTGSMAAFVLSMLLILQSVAISEKKALGDLTRVENDSGTAQIASQNYATDGKNLYLYYPGKGSWLPFAAGYYELCTQPDGYCEPCQSIMRTAFCTNCGKELTYTRKDKVCQSCGTFCDTEYCGSCGSKYEEGES